MSVSPAEADTLAHDYLPTDAVKQIRENRGRRELRDLPTKYRDLGVLSRTIIDGVARTSERDLRAGQGSFQGRLWAWRSRLLIRWRAWNAAGKISAGLHEHVARDEDAMVEAAERALGIVERVDRFVSQSDYGVECFQLRQEYVRRLQGLGLREDTMEEACAALDAVINYHLTLLCD